MKVINLAIHKHYQNNTHTSEEIQKAAVPSYQAPKKKLVTGVCTPEMGEYTTAEIQYKCSYGGGYYFTSHLELKGRGLRQTGDGSNHKEGKKSYHATERAMGILKTKHECCLISHLD